MKNKLTILLVSLPFITTDGDLLCGAFPVQNDVNYQLLQGLQDLGINAVQPHWILEGESLRMSLAGVNLDEIDAMLLDINTVPSKLSYIQEILDIGKPIAVFIADYYFRDDLVEMVTQISQFSDLIISGYSGIKDLLGYMGLSAIAEKTFEMLTLPMRLNLPNPVNKIFDICYIGTNKYYRLDALRRLLDLNYSLYINTAGRTAKEGNSLCTTEAYLNKMALSRFSVVTSADRGTFLPLLTHHLC